METVLVLLRFFGIICIAITMGKLVSKFKLPSVLGWLLTGMIFGPHAIGLMTQDIMDAEWYNVVTSIVQCFMGLMIGSELVWKKIKSSGKSIIITTFTQSVGTFLFVSAVFAITFYFTNVPIYLAFIFGSIALATAPAPALSIVKDFKTRGPVTNTLIPMAALDDIVGCLIFFTTISIVSAQLASGSVPSYMVIVLILLPIVIGIVCGFVAGFILKKSTNDKITTLLICTLALITAGFGFLFTYVVFPGLDLNFMLIGMSFSATFCNMIPEERVKQIMKCANPFLGFGLVVVILDLGLPLDYHLIAGAGVYTAIYIIARAIGKYSGAYLGASITHSPKTVKRYLGLTLLPHSGVSLVFTGFAASAIEASAPESAQILTGTIAAAAIINEFIAVIAAKKGFQWAGELNKNVPEPEIEQSTEPVVTQTK